MTKWCQKLQKLQWNFHLNVDRRGGICHGPWRATESFCKSQLTGNFQFRVAEICFKSGQLSRYWSSGPESYIIGFHLLSRLPLMQCKCNIYIVYTHFFKIIRKKVKFALFEFHLSFFIPELIREASLIRGGCDIKCLIYTQMIYIATS